MQLATIMLWVKGYLSTRDVLLYLVGVSGQEVSRANYPGSSSAQVVASFPASDPERTASVC